MLCRELQSVLIASALAAAFASPSSESASLIERFRGDATGQGRVALTLARRALEHYCLTREPLPVPRNLPPLLRERGAVFVSAMVYGKPRCCMGTLIPKEPTLAEEIIANASAAAVHDKRFPPTRPVELGRLRIVVSIIGERQPVANPSVVDPLRDGLAVRGPRETGIVLPGETGDLKTMVAWGRLRAGMKSNEEARYFRLEAVRFMEPPRRKEEIRRR